MSKLHLGEKNGRMGLWIAPSGGDASSETDRLILNSDHDHLQIHATGQKTLNGFDNGDGTYFFDSYTINYETLGYYPFVIVGSSVRNNIIMLHPMTIAPWLQDLSDTEGGVGVNIYLNKLVTVPFDMWGPSSIRLTWMIFKNRIADPIP